MWFSRFMGFRTSIVLFSMLLISACVKDDIKSPTSNNIKKIITDKNGLKWIATDNGLHSYDGTKWDQFRGFPFGNSYKYEDGNISSSNDGEIWFAGNTGSIMFKFNETAIESKKVYTKNSSGLLSNSVTAVAADQFDTRYFGTSLGLSINKGDKWESFVGRKNEEILREYKITSIATAKNGWIYAATYGGGVSRFKYTDAVSGATLFDSIWSQLKSNYVNTVIIVDDTIQWYGTNRGACLHISHYTKEIFDWQSYTTAEGLPSDTVLSIAKDLDGNIWFGTTAGAARLNGTQITVFTTADGLVSDKINTISADTDGSLWFGTNKGLSQFKDGNWKTARVNE